MSQEKQEAKSGLEDFLQRESYTVSALIAYVCVLVLGMVLESLLGISWLNILVFDAAYISVFLVSTSCFFLGFVFPSLFGQENEKLARSPLLLLISPLVYLVSWFWAYRFFSPQFVEQILGLFWLLPVSLLSLEFDKFFYLLFVLLDVLTRDSAFTPALFAWFGFLASVLSLLGRGEIEAQQLVEETREYLSPLLRLLGLS